MRRAARAGWPTAAFTAVVLLSLVVLFTPRAPAGPGVPQLDKLIHATLFGLLAATTRWRFGRGQVLVVAYAVISEVLQAVLSIERDGDPLDAMADTVGAVHGWFLAGRPTQARGLGLRR